MIRAHNKILEPHGKKERKGKRDTGKPRRKSKTPPHVHTKTNGCTETYVSANGEASNLTKNLRKNELVKL
jgi:hypothetical protein